MRARRKYGRYRARLPRTVQVVDGEPGDDEVQSVPERVVAELALARRDAITEGRERRRAANEHRGRGIHRHDLPQR